LIDFHKIWYEGYAIGEHSNLVHSNFLQSVITTWQTGELLRWERHLRLLMQSPGIMYGNECLKYL